MENDVFDAETRARWTRALDVAHDVRLSVLEREIPRPWLFGRFRWRMIRHIARGLLQSERHRQEMAIRGARNRGRVAIASRRRRAANASRQARNPRRDPALRRSDPQGDHRPRSP